MLGKPRHQMDMCHGSLADKILKFAIPLMASSILQLLFNAADVIVVGRFAGKESLAAVGSTTSLINLLIALFVGLSVGTNVVVARNLGGKRHDMVSKAVHTSILMALVSGAVLAVFGAIMSHQLLVWMSSPEDVINLSTLYLRIYFLGMPATMAYNFGAAILRAQGDTQRPLFYLIIAGVVNVVLNLVSVILMGMGVAGVAMATTISQYISAGLVLMCLTQEDGPLRLNLRDMNIDRHILGQIMEIGLPAGFQGIVFSLSNVLIQSSINSFGSTVVAGSAASANIENFVYQAMNAFYQTNLTFTGQNYGAGECKRVDKSLIYCQTFVIITGVVLGNLAYLFGHPLVSIYAPGEEDVIQQGIIRLGYIARTYALCGIMDTMVGSLRGLGYSVGPMIVSLIGACGLRIVWIFTIFQVDRTPENLYISYPISWIVTGAVHIIFFLIVRKKPLLWYVPTPMWRQRVPTQRFPNHKHKNPVLPYQRKHGIFLFHTGLVPQHRFALLQRGLNLQNTLVGGATEAQAQIFLGNDKGTVHQHIQLFQQSTAIVPHLSGSQILKRGSRCSTRYPSGDTAVGPA